MRRAGSWVAWPAVACALLLACDPAGAADVLAPGICPSMDIRNNPDAMEKLGACRVIEGHLSIVLMERATSASFQNVSFPKLREVTGYILIYRLKGVRNLGDLFPNLSVIRGMQLFKDFALVIFDNGLESLGLRSLTRIERGAVRIQNNDQLCYANTIDWTRINTEADNNIIRSNYDTRLCGLCPNAQSRMEDHRQIQFQCPADFTGRLLCWDDKHCQKKDCPSKCNGRACMSDGTCCHHTCLGGCDGPSPSDCHVCANFSLGYEDKRTCVDRCPANTYELSRRCVTEQECRSTPPPQNDFADAAQRAPTIRAYKLLFNRSCVYFCPSGYMEKMSNPEPTPGPSSSSQSERIPDPPLFLRSPMKKRPKRTLIGSNEKMIAINIYKLLMNIMVTYPYKTDVVHQVSEVMGISIATVKRILSEYKKTGKVSSPKKSKPSHVVISKLDDFILMAIRRKVHQFYFDNELPTVDKILTVVNDDQDLPSFSRSTMFRILKKLKFSYVKRSRKSILLERPELMAWRTKYLLKIKDYRKENRKIYYTDETWLNEGHTVNYIWIDQDIESSRQAFLSGLSTGPKNPQKGKRVIITHIGSEDGFLEGGEWIFEAKKTDAEGDYHGEMDSNNFEKWFAKILELLDPGSVIVLDNAPYHSRLAERIPNMSWRKADIQTWLQDKGFVYHENDTKALLLTKFNKDNFKNKVIDNMAATKNIILLRLPPYHCELNPIELIWAQLKSYVGKNNKTFKMAELKVLITDGIRQISAVSWRKCIEHIIKEEDKMMRLDGIIDTSTSTTPEFIINVTDESSTSGSSEDI